MRLHTAAGLILALTAVCAAQEAPDAPESPATTAAAKLASMATALELKANAFAPRGIVIKVTFVERGHSFEWRAQMNGTPDQRTMAKEAWSTATSTKEIMLDWSRHFAAHAVRLTAEHVFASGLDPQFNPQSDITVNFESIASYVGTRRTGTNQPTTGGELTIEVKPERGTWAVEEAITGTITIKNTGTSRVELPHDLEENLILKDSSGNAAKTVMTACILKDWPDRRYLGPGESLQQELIVKSAAGQGGPLTRHAYVLEPGTWTIHYPSLADYNLTMVGGSATITVTAAREKKSPPTSSEAGGAKN